MIKVRVREKMINAFYGIGIGLTLVTIGFKDYQYLPISLVILCLAVVFHINEIIGERK